MMRAAAAGHTPMDDAPLPENTPPQLAALMRECLAFDARERSSACAVAERLASLLGELT